MTEGITNKESSKVLRVALLIRHELSPNHGSAFADVGIDGEVGKAAVGRGAVPVHHVGRNVYGFARPKELDSFALLLVVARARCGYQNLSVWVGVPVVARARLEGYVAHCAIRQVVGGDERFYPRYARKIVGRSLGGPVRWCWLFVVGLVHLPIICRYVALRQCGHVDDEPVPHVAFQHSVVGRVDVLDVNQLNIGDDVVFRAEIQHLLRFSNAANR